MPRLTRRPRRAVALAVLAVAASLAGSSPAQAVTAPLQYTCVYPYAKAQPLAVTLEVATPSHVWAGHSTGPLAITAGLVAGGRTSGLVELIGASTVEGVVDLNGTVEQAGGGVPFSAALTLPKQAVAETGDLPLTASGAVLPLTFPDAGNAKFTLGRLALRLTFRDADGAALITPGTLGSVNSDPTVVALACTLTPATQDTTLANLKVVNEWGQQIVTPPNPTISALAPTAATVCWPAGDGATPYTYEVTGPNGFRTVTSQHCVALTGLAMNTPYVVWVAARDAAGNSSEKASVPFTTPSVGGPMAPSRPGKPVATAVDAKALTLTWDAATDDQAVASYAVYGTTVLGPTLLGTTTDPALRVTRLTPETAYQFTVVAIDEQGNQSTPTDPISVTTPPEVIACDCLIQYDYAVAGTATLKTLIKGSVPLTGALTKVSLGLPNPDLTAHLKFNDATANLTALGFLPVTAKLSIVATAPVTGSLSKGVLVANAKVRIKLPSVTLFGVQLGGGSTCQTKAVSNIALKSTDPFFYPTKGGSIAGTFAISDLTGCGALNGIISPLTAGKGNAIALNLAPVV